MKNKSFSVEEVISGGGGLFPTNSMLFLTSLVKKMPDFYMNAPIGDYPITIFLALKGDVYYIDRCMSVYRYMTEGSWTRRMSMNYKARIEHTEKIGNMLREIDKYTDYRYTNTINDTIWQMEFELLQENFNIKQLKLAKYNKYYCKLSFRQKARIYI